jgi:hypothetical protein
MSEPSECTFDACDPVLDLAKVAAVIAGSDAAKCRFDVLNVGINPREGGEELAACGLPVAQLRNVGDVLLVSPAQSWLMVKLTRAMIGCEFRSSASDGVRIGLGVHETPRIA